MKRILGFGLVVAAAVFFLSVPTQEEKRIAAIDKALPKTVMVYTKTVVEKLTFKITNDSLRIVKSTETVTVRGAGVFVSPNGHVLTVAHLWLVGEPISVSAKTFGGQHGDAEILAIDEKRDLMLLKVGVSTPTPYAVLADPRTLKVGQEAFAIGNPLGFEWSVSHGILSAFHVDDKEGGMYDFTQSDTFLSPGNSGGPLLDMRGRLVGINSRIYSAARYAFSGLGFSTSSGQILEFLTEFRGLEVQYE